MFKVIIKDKEWLIPLSILCKIGLLNEIYNSTNDMNMCLDVVDADIFDQLYELLKSGDTINIENYSVLIRIIKLGDYLMCDSLVKDLCIYLSAKMEFMSEEDLKNIYDEWEKKSE
jgi:hypothetical protein